MRAVWQPESVTRRMSEITSTALLWGFDAIELRSVGGPEDRVPHVSERLIRTSCMDADLAVAALDPEFFAGSAGEKATWMNELAMLPEVIQLAGRLGKPGIILGSLEHEDGDDDSVTAAALERIFDDAGRLAGKKGLILHVRTGSERHAAIALDAMLSARSNVFRPMPEIGFYLPQDGPPGPIGTSGSATSADSADSAASAEAIRLPEWLRDAAYVRLIYHGPRTVSLDEADDMRDRFQVVVERLKEFDSVTDICLEFARRPDPATGLRVSTAFVSALNRI